MANSEKLVITRNGMAVDCYGVWDETSNCLVVGTYDDGEEFEEIWAEGADNWIEVVETLTAWARKHHLTIDELTAC